MLLVRPFTADLQINGGTTSNHVKSTTVGVTQPGYKTARHVPLTRRT